MGKRDDLDDLEKELEKAHDESKARKEGSGKYGTIYKDDADITKWRCKNGEHVIDIIPYRAGAFDPNRPEGKAAYFLDIYVHKNVGLSNESFVCPSRNYKKKCPICEEIKRQADKDVPYDDYKDDVAKRVNVYNMVCYDNEDEEAKGVQVWDISNFFMEDKLRGLAKNKRTGESIYFASPKQETGRSIAFERKGKGKGNVEFLSHEFLKRDYDISRKLLEQAVCLDEVIHQPTYEEIYEAYFEEPYSEKKSKKDKESEEDSGSSGRSRRSRDNDDNEDSGRDRKNKHRDADDDDKKKSSKKDDDELTWDELLEMSEKKMKKYIKDNDVDVDPDDHEDDEDGLREAIAEELDIELPKKKDKKKKDDDDDDRGKGKKKSKKDDDDEDCPAKGGEFGVDCDTLAACKKCDLWDDCAKKHDEIESEGSSKKDKKRNRD